MHAALQKDKKNRSRHKKDKHDSKCFGAVQRFGDKTKDSEKHHNKPGHSPKPKRRKTRKPADEISTTPAPLHFIPAGTNLSELEMLQKNNRDSPKMTSIHRAVNNLADSTPDGEKVNFAISECQVLDVPLDRTQSDSKKIKSDENEPGKNISSTKKYNGLEKVLSDDKQELVRKKPSATKVQPIQKISPIAKVPPIKDLSAKDVPKSAEPESPHPLDVGRSLLQFPETPAPEKEDGSTLYPLSPKRVDADLIGRTGMYCERGLLQKDRKLAFDWLAYNRNDYENNSQTLSDNLGIALYDVGVKKDLICESLSVLCLDKQLSTEELAEVKNKVADLKGNVIPLSTIAWILKESCTGYQ